MSNRKLSALAILIVGVAGGTAVYVLNTPEPRTNRVVWLHGSANVVHDQLIADSIVGAEVRFGLWCSSDTATSTPMDILFSARAESYLNCGRGNQAGLWLVGGGNYPESVGDTKETSRVFVSNGGAYGQRVDFYVDEPNLGDAQTRAANWLLTQGPFTASELRTRLTGEPTYIDGRYVGVQAQELQPPPDVGYLPAVYYTLGD